MSELENIENVEQSTGEVSGEVSGEVIINSNSDKSLFN